MSSGSITCSKRAGISRGSAWPRKENSRPPPRNSGARNQPKGCTMLREKAAPAEAALRKRLDDPSGAIQIAAAEALARIGKVDAALPVLEKWVQNSDAPFFELQAANVLDRLGEAARPALPAM